MIGYLDSSVILRTVFREPGRIVEWEDVEPHVTSLLTEVECLRTLDRLRLRALGASDGQALLHKLLRAALDRLNLLAVDRTVLDRAALPFPVPLGTLDALHLATALLWQESNGEPIAMATHDSRLALAATACGLRVIGA